MARRPAPVDPDRLARLAGAEPGWRLDLPETPVGEDAEPDNVIAHLRGAEELARRGFLSPPPPADAGRHRPVAPPAVSLPERLVDARWQPRWTAVLAVLVVLLCAGVVFGVRVAMARSAGEPQVIGRGAGASAAATASGQEEGVRHGSGHETTGSGAGATEAVGTGPSTAPTGVVVDVDGQVRRRGVVRLGPGARVVDALTASGGAMPGADLAGLNQARVLADGELVYVPRHGESPPVSAPQALGSGTSGVGASPGSGAVGSGTVGGVTGAGGVAGAPTPLVDLNQATPEQLDSLPGVGPAIAGRITQWRSEHGRFSSVDELGEVSGIGPKMLERLRPLVRV